MRTCCRGEHRDKTSVNVTVAYSNENAMQASLSQLVGDDNMALSMEVTFASPKENRNSAFEDM